jgi:hypothetical protein
MIADIDNRAEDAGFPAEPSTIDELVRRHTPELIPQSDPGIRLALSASFFLLTATVAVTALTAIGIHGSALTPLLASVAGLVGGAGISWQMRRSHRVQLQRFSQQLEDSPWMFYDAVASKFLAEVERQRARTIGPTSEWGRARSSLESAAQEADRSVAYWTHRLSRERDEIAQAQLTAATRLRDKFHTALSDLDERAHLLIKFFNDCEGRVAVLKSTTRDAEEIRKLEALADRSDELVTHAERTLASIGASFVSEALRVGDALGELERVGLVNLAGDVPVDQLEALADRILESTERDRSALEGVAKSI